MKKETKEKLVDDIVKDVQADMCNCEDFALGCVRQVVSRWGKKRLCRWFGGEYENDPDKLIRELEEE